LENLRIEIVPPFKQRVQHDIIIAIGKTGIDHRRRLSMRRPVSRRTLRDVNNVPRIRNRKWSLPRFDVDVIRVHEDRLSSS
jgi:hypothetical protein